MLSPSREHRRWSKKRVHHAYLIFDTPSSSPSDVRSEVHTLALGERNASRCLCFRSDDASDYSAKTVMQGNDLNTEKGLKWFVCAGAWLEKAPKKGNAQMERWR